MEQIYTYLSKSTSIYYESLSSIKPTFMSSTILLLSTSYIWKPLVTKTDTKRNGFLNNIL